MAAPSANDSARVQELLRQYSQWRQEFSQISHKLVELEGELNEHTLLLETIKPFNPDRRCWRMVSGVLVEHTVGDVIPAVETNRNGIMAIMNEYRKQYETRESDIAQFEKKHGDLLKDAQQAM